MDSAGTYYCTAASRDCQTIYEWNNEIVISKFRWMLVSSRRDRHGNVTPANESHRSPRSGIAVKSDTRPVATWISWTDCFAEHYGLESLHKVQRAIGNHRAKSYAEQVGWALAIFDWNFREEAKHVAMRMCAPLIAIYYPQSSFFNSAPVRSQTSAETTRPVERGNGRLSRSGSMRCGSIPSR